MGIRGYELADDAAKAALTQRSTIITLHYSDFKPLDIHFGHTSEVNGLISGQIISFSATHIRMWITCQIKNDMSVTVTKRR